MKKPFHILALGLVFVLLLGNGEVQSPSFSEEILVKERSATWLKQQALPYLEQLPQQSKTSAKPVVEEADRLKVNRSFLVHKSRGVLSHVVADIEYTALVQIANGRYTYEFSNFKVYPYERDRYGRYSRSSSRGKSIDKVGKELKPWVNQAIQKNVTQYAEGLKMALGY